MRTIVTNFPDFTSKLTDELKDAGLKELDIAGKAKSDFEVAAFQSIITTQPQFMISRKSWVLLKNGQQILYKGTPNEKIISWLPAGYEVFGFVFCTAKNHDLFANYPNDLYFRIRTIIKKTETNGDGNNMIVEVDTENIAYVDIVRAQKNKNLNPYYLQKDCVIFVENSNTLLRNKVDEGVFLKEKTRTDLPSQFQDQGTLIVHEGSIFGKDRIWELISRYTKRGSLVSLKWELNDISFDFKINVQSETSIKCPEPSTCKPPQVN
jgi:hypothetical protein